MDLLRQHQANNTPSLSAAEREKVLYQWNNNKADFPRESTLHELISVHAGRTPDRTAVAFEGTSLTYAELDKRGNQLAHHLISLGVGVESLVGLYAPRSLEMIVGILGILKAGGAYVPIDPELPTARIKLMLEDAQPTILLTFEELVSSLDNDHCTTVCLDSDWPLIAKQSVDLASVKMSSKNLAYVIYTSGSTGAPKGVQVTHRSVVNLLQAKNRYTRIEPRDHVLATTTISFDPSVWEIFLTLTRGAQLTIAPREAVLDGARLQQMIEEGNVTVMRGTPTNWRLLLASGWQGKPDLRAVTGGEALTLDLALEIRKRCAFLSNGYGPTEITIAATTSVITPDSEQITIGRPYDNMQVFILDEKLEPVPVGAAGEIYISGEGVSRGYLNRPELTAERFIPNPFAVNGSNFGKVMYKTGDLARYLPDGRILFLGRNDSQVKIRGYRIELGDIEAAVRRHPAISDNVTLAREDTPGDLRLVTYLIPEKGHKVPGARDLREFLRRSLPEYMLPARFVFLDKFPVSPNGKIDRRALPAPDRWVEEINTEYIPPRTDVEKETADLFADTLNLERISINDSFFELGGNSLLAARVVYKAEECFRVKIPLRSFLAQPTVAGLSQVITTTPQHGANGQLTANNMEIEAGGAADSELLRQSNLTRGQFLMWMGQQINPTAPLYNVVHAFTIHGQLDVDAFQRAFRALVDHSDSLRTTILQINGVPQQQVSQTAAARIEMVDYSLEDEPQNAYQTWLDERKIRPLTMDQQLYDAALVKLAPDRFVWYLCQHHIMTDAVSAELLFERLANYYQLALDGRLDEIPPPPQYADFVKYERELRQSADFQQAAAYWREKYGAPLPPTDFYGKSLPERAPSLRTERVVYSLGAKRCAKLREIARQDSFASPSEDMSLFTIFAVLLLTTLHRIGGQHTLRLGAPFHGRPTAESLDIIGLFIEMGVLQVEVEDGETFTSLGEKVMAETLAGLSHIQPGVSSADVNRAYDVILNFIQATFHDFAGLPVTREPVHTGHIDADHNLRLQIADYDGSGNLHLHFDMKTDLFGEVERVWLVEHFLQVVDAFIADHRQSLGSFALLGAAERQKLLVDFNATTAPYPSDQTVVQLFEAQVAKTPQAIAAVEGLETIPYTELNERANRLAHYLKAQGVGPETAVAICMPRSIDVLVAIWGVLKAGGLYIPIDPAYPLERIAYMLSDGAPKILLTTDKLALSELNVPDGMGVANLTTLDLSGYSGANPQTAALPENLVYMIYTSGSTGRPKGTMLTHQGLMNYACWARRTYQENEALDFPLYSSLAFDLTVTSIFVPLLSGGKIVIYGESDEAPGLEILSVFREDAVDIVKLTPAHLSLVRELSLTGRRIRKLIVGGEDFKTDLACSIHDLFGGNVEIYNEYGPTEAVVGCMLHRYDPELDTAVSVPIGKPAANARIYLLDEYDQPTPPGVVGEMVISSDGVARGYHNRPQLTAERFGADPFRSKARIYRSGDIARWNEEGQMVFLGRRDHQVKISGGRIELGEVEATLLTHGAIQDAVVTVVQFERRLEENEIVHCVTCGLPSNFPDVTFNEDGVCNLCTDFDIFRDDVFQYFKSMDDLHAIVDKAKAERSSGRNSDYDCMMLYSGGKDSTYVLSQLIEMGLKVLAFSLDNGYISEDAKDNIRRVTNHLGVDLVFATTPHMNAIFADSLERFSNVCQGCYKAIYTLSMNLARQKGIKYIFTGLSRGQLFETRLDVLFRNRIFDVAQMDEAILQARKVYHRVDDAVNQLLDVSIFSDDRVFNEIQFVDFFRYTEVELDELYDFLSTRAPWIRPRDTGRSTNCLINEAGIFVHQIERGYHNYAMPYSWDVRLGHKTREEAMEELDDDIRLPMVEQMLDEVGYTVKDWHADQSERRLAAYYLTGDAALTNAELRRFLADKLPAYMMPAYFVRLEAMPLTPNGKVDRRGLPNPTEKRPELDAVFVNPQSPLEIQLAAIWSQTLNVKRIGIHDDFFDLGGASIPAVQVVAKISQQFEVTFPLSSFFAHPTIAEQSELLEELLIAQLEELSDEEVAALLAEMGD